MITERNKSALQFLDLMTNIDRYSEIKGAELLKKTEGVCENNRTGFFCGQRVPSVL